jgi:hypothetical protein
VVKHSLNPSSRPDRRTKAAGEKKIEASDDDPVRPTPREASLVKLSLATSRSLRGEFVIPNKLSHVGVLVDDAHIERTGHSVFGFVPHTNCRR